MVVVIPFVTFGTWAWVSGYKSRIVEIRTISVCVSIEIVRYVLRCSVSILEFRRPCVWSPITTGICVTRGVCVSDSVEATEEKSWRSEVSV